MAESEPFYLFAAGLPALPLPVLATDVIVVTRSGVDYRLPPGSIFPVGGSIVYAVPLSGDTLTAAYGQGGTTVEPAAEIAALTQVLPPSARDQQTFEFSTTQTIDAFTFTAAAGQSLAPGVSAGAALGAGGGTSVRFRLSNLTWYPRT